jgi:hypothetical protein
MSSDLLSRDEKPDNYNKVHDDNCSSFSATVQQSGTAHWWSKNRTPPQLLL